MNLIKQRKYADENGMDVALFECDENGNPIKYHIPRKVERIVRDSAWVPPCDGPEQGTIKLAPQLVDGASIEDWCEECLRYAIREASEDTEQ